MAIGFWEVAFVLTLFFGIVIVTRLIERSRTKRICPACGLVIRTYMPTCPACHHKFQTKNKGG